MKKGKLFITVLFGITIICASFFLSIIISESEAEDTVSPITYSDYSLINNNKKPDTFNIMLRNTHNYMLEKKIMQKQPSRNSYTLNISINGSAFVIKNPDATVYSHGTLVTVTAIPDRKWNFSHWSGDHTGNTNPTIINMTSNKTITAHFTAPLYPYNLTLPGNWVYAFQSDLTPLIHAIRPTFGGAYGPVYFEDDVIKLKPYISHAHNLSLKVGKYYSFIHVEHPESYTRVPELIDNATVIDLDGNKIEDFFTPGHYMLCINRPFYRDFLINISKKGIDAGADRVMYDVGYAWIFSFDPDSIEGFRTYLDLKYNDTYLLDNYNISNISTFDYGQYLRDLDYNASNIQQSAWSGNPPPLWFDWSPYMKEIEREFYARLYTELTNHGIQEYGKEIIIEENRYWEPTQFMMAENETKLCGETFIGSLEEGKPYPNITLAPLYKTSVSIGKRFSSWNHPQFNASNPLSVNRTNLFIAETYASGGHHGILEPGRIWHTWDQWVLIRDNIVPYWRFVLWQPSLFNNVSENSEIGLLYSFSSNQLMWEWAFRGAFYLLGDCHYTYDVIFGGDRNWMPDLVQLHQLSKYKAVFLPNTQYLTDNQIRVLLNYTANGGILIATSDNVDLIGKYDECQTVKNRTAWHGLFTGGVETYGNGSVISWNTTLAKDYYFYRKNGNKTGLQETQLIFKNNITSLFAKDIITDFPPEVNFYRYNRLNDSSDIYHLVNYHYNHTTHSIKVLNGNISIPVPTNWQNKTVNVSLLKVPTLDPVNISFTQIGNRINFTIENLSIWAIIKIGSLAENAHYQDYEPMSRIKYLWGIEDHWWKPPFNLAFRAVDDINLSQIRLYYRYSIDNQSWTNWTIYDTLNISGEIAYGNFSFNASTVYGMGYYGFFLQALDNSSQEEPLFNAAQKISPPPMEDNYPPLTSLILSGPTYGPNDEWVTSATQFNLTAYDNLSGVNIINYRIWYNGSWTPWIEYTMEFTLTDECTHYLEFYSIDNAGNPESIQNQTHYVDNSPPNTIEDIENPSYLNEYWATTNSTIWINTTDEGCLGGVGIRYVHYEIWWDSNEDDIIDYLVISGNIYGGSNTMHSFSEECLHEVRWYSVDLLYNTETMQTRQHRVDNSPPEAVVNPTGDPTNVPFTLTASATDFGCGGGCGVKDVELWYRYSTNNISWTAWTYYDIDLQAPWAWTFYSYPYGIGYYEFVAKATDNLENREPGYIQPTEASFYVFFNTFSKEMYQGWNLITLPFNHNWTAETFGQNITGCTIVSMFNASSQSFVTHIVGVPWDDFPLKDGISYFVYVTSNTTYCSRDTLLTSVSVHMVTEWNLLGWYHEYNSTAESLGENISGCTLVLMFDAETQTFLTHVVGTPWDNFNIERGMGLFIYATVASTWYGDG